MFDIGIGEILVIGVIGLLVFGPERLPRAAADAARWLRDLRTMASGARKDLADSAGIDLSETVDTVRSLQEFHPKRLATSLLKDDGAAEGKPAADGNGKAADGKSAGTDPSTDRPAFDPDAT